MTLSLTVERRVSPRHRCTERQAVTWKNGLLGIRRHGWLYDASDEGFSFLADASDAPRVGQSVEIIRESDDARSWATVVRNQPVAAGRVLVGCRLTSIAPPRPMCELADAA